MLLSLNTPKISMMPAIFVYFDNRFLFFLQVEGIEGIMAAYASALHNVALAGPTLFGQVINTAAEIAGRSLSSNISKYFVLLIITVQLNLSKLSFSHSLSGNNMISHFYRMES